MASSAIPLLTMEPLNDMPSLKNQKAVERIYKQFDQITAQSPYEWKLLERCDSKKALKEALQVHGLGKIRKSWKTSKINHVIMKHYQAARFTIRLMSLQRHKKFALYAHNGAKVANHEGSVLDTGSDVETDEDESRDAPPPVSVVDKNSLQTTQTTKKEGLFSRWLSSIQFEEPLNMVTTDMNDSIGATVPFNDANLSNVSTTVSDEPLNSAETAKGSSLERHIPEKWKLIDRFNDFTTLNKIRKAKNVHFCRIKSENGITEKYYRCNSCKYKMWSRQKGDKCVLYYSGEHNHSFEQLDTKQRNSIPKESVPLNVPIVSNPPNVPKVVPVVVNPTDKDAQIITGVLADATCGSAVPNQPNVPEVVPIIVNSADSDKLVITEHVSKVDCAPFSCYSLSCLTQLTVEFGLELVIDNYMKGQFSLRKDDRLLKFIITETKITVIFREYIDLEHIEHLPSTNWGQFLTDIRRKCSNVFVN